LDGEVSMKLVRVLLVAIVVTLFFGGAVRILADRPAFEAFGMGSEWPEKPYSVYIYRVLGGFVILVGVVLLGLSRDPARYARVIRALGRAASWSVAC
jgi:hypothetical protein